MLALQKMLSKKNVKSITTTTLQIMIFTHVDQMVLVGNVLNITFLNNIQLSAFPSSQPAHSPITSARSL